MVLCKAAQNPSDLAVVINEMIEMEMIYEKIWRLLGQAGYPYERQRKAYNGKHTGLGRALAVLCLLLFIGLAQAAGPVVWVTPSMIRTGPSDAAPIPATTTITLSAAKGEYQSFQIVVQAPAGGLTNVHLSVPASLSGSAGSIPAVAGSGSYPYLNISAFREYYVNLPGPSSANYPCVTSCSLGGGTYPDALIPANDPDTGTALTGGSLTAFPFSLASGNQPLWIDVFVPRSTNSGSYSGTFTVTSDQGSAQVTLDLTVWNFTLPLIPALKTSYLTSDAPHQVNTDLELMRNRLQPEQATSLSEAQNLSTNWGYHNTSLGYYSGVDNACGTASSPPSVSSLNSAQAQYTSLGFFVYDYSFDEINTCGSSTMQAVVSWATALHSASPPVSQLITMVPTTQLMTGDGLTTHSAVDIWTVESDYFLNEPGYPNYQVLIAQAQAKGDQIWSYTTEVQDAYTPKWEIDFNPVDFRIFVGFIDQSLGATGNLYWSVDGWLHGTTVTSWTDVGFKDGGGSFYGDGILVYPGEPVGITNKVVPSMRLKWLRDGVQDYEYVQALKNAGQGGWALAQIQPIAASMSSWTQDPSAVEALRMQLGNKLNASSGGPPPPLVSSLVCSPVSLATGASSVCTVTLNQAASSGGIVVALSSNNTLLTVPASVTVAAGATSNTFAATTGSVASNQTASVTASVNGVSQQASISLVATVVSSLSCIPTSLGTAAISSCTVTLSQAASTGGATVALSSNSGLLVVPTSVAVTAGATTTTLTVTAGTITSNASAIVTATYNGSSQQGTISLVPAITISSLSCSPASVATGGTSACTVTLAQPAPAGGAFVTLSSNNGLLLVPASVTVAAGSTTSTFTATAGTINTNQSAIVTAVYNNGTVTATLSLTASAMLSSLGCTMTTLTSGAISTCTVTVSQSAPASGLVVSLSSNNTILSVPASITVATQGTAATFTAAAGTIPTDQTATVTATLNAASQAITLSLSAPISITGFTCTPASVTVNGSANCQLTISKNAPAGGTLVSISSSNGVLTAPPSTTIASGTNSAMFTVTAGSISTMQSVTLTASMTGSSTTATVAVVPQNVISLLSCVPATLVTATSATCTATLSGPAGPGGALVSLSSDQPLLTVPPSITMAAGASTGTFTATAGTITSNRTASVTATFSGTSQTATLSLVPQALLSSLACAPNALASGGSSTCIVTLSAAAPAGGATIALSSSNGVLTVPASLTVPAGTTSTTFTATAGAVVSNQTGSVSATYNNSSQQATFTLTASAALTSLGCTITSLRTGAGSTCTLTLSAPAPAGGATVLLSSDNPLLALPPSVTVAAGATTGTFMATGSTINSTQTANISASYNGSTQTTAITLLGQATLSAVACPVTSLKSGAVTTCSVTLTSAAPAGGSLVMLATSNPALIVPASITVSAGTLVSTFAATAGSVNVNQAVVITASLNGTTQTVSLTVSPAQTVITQSSGSLLVNGNYYVRQVSLGTDSTGHLTDPRSVIGTITFDGAGNYSFTGQSAQNGAALAQSANGTYSVDGAGILSMDSLVRGGERVNARFSPEAILGATTESVSNAYDFFVAIPAPSAPTNNASLTGPYPTATLEFPTGSFANARNAFFSLNSAGDGTFQPISVTGHAADHASSQITTEQITGATYAMANNGSGSMSFGSASAVLNGTKTVYLSQDGNVLLGGTANSYDILIGIRAESQVISNSNWTGPFWGAGLRFDPTAVKSFVGAAVASGAGNLYWTRRLKGSGPSNMDFTEVDPYSLLGGGSGTSGLTEVTLGGASNLFLGSSVNNNDANGYELYFGARMPTVNGSGLYLNPQGIQNVASYAPTGNPIAPGELIYLYVSGLTVTPQTATPPYPVSLSGVTVLINGSAAPLYLVSTTQLVAVVPFATTGTTASIVVQANGMTSNAVTAPVAVTAPGVFSQLENGSGLGAIRHSDYGVVTAANPAHSGEVVLVYLTGLGAVTPPIADGAGGSANPLSITTVSPTVMIGSSPATVLFSGMSAYPGLYQINVQLPAIPAGTTTLPLIITTPNAFHDQVDIAVAP